MKRLLSLFSFFLIFSSSLLAEDKTPVQILLQQADKAYQKRTDLKECEKALAFYQEAMNLDPQNVEALWKGSQAIWWLGDAAEKKKQKKIKFQQGIDWAQKSLELDPECAPCYFWLGGNQGSYGEAKGILKSLFLLKPIRHAMNRMNEIDPSYSSGGAYRILGIVDYKVPGFAGGNKKRSLTLLQKALSFGEKDPHAHYYLAEYYSIVNNWEKSKEHLSILDSLTEVDSDPADLKKMKDKAKALRKKKKKLRDNS